MVCFDHELKLREIDTLKKPYAVRNTMSLAFTTGIVDFFQPDRKLDDCELYSDEEPVASTIDNFAQNNKVERVVSFKKEEEQTEENISPGREVRSRHSFKSKSVLGENDPRKANVQIM